MLDNKVLTLPQNDIEQIASELSSIWPTGKNIFITGGTGFFGRWIVESIFAVEKKLNRKNQYFILSRRSRAEVIKAIPVLAADCFSFVQSDINNLKESDIPAKLDYVINGAVDVATYKQNEGDSQFGKGTAHLLQIVKGKNVQRFLHLSSGAVYEDLTSSPFKETDISDLDLKKISAKDYTNEKRASEAYVIESGLPYFILRCFAFVGPFLNESMAIMDMIKAKLEGREITVNSPSVIRSYLYPVDLITQLFKVLFLQRPSTTFNLGSPHQINLGDLARAIAQVEGAESIVKLATATKDVSLGSSQYVPDMTKLYTTLNIQKPIVDLATALRKTLNFEKTKRGIK